MNDKYQTIKIWKTTLSNLRLLAALREQPIVKVLDELITLNLENMKRAGPKD